ncbi:MAG: hypothetical protein V1817_01670 [Candidatus Micrarchaeota archaeon]
MQKWVLAVLAAITAVAAAANVSACWGYGCNGYYNDYYDYAEPGVYYVPYGGGSCWGYACGYYSYPRYAYGGYAGYGYTYSYSYSYAYNYGYGNYGYGYNSHYDAGYHAQLANYCAGGWC